MPQSPTEVSTRTRSAVVLFTQTFPLGRGEEFLEAEIPRLLDVFDRVVVVPTLHLPTMDQTRELPEGAVMVRAAVRRASSVVAFCARHPLEATGAFARALRAAPKLRHIRADLRFDLYSLALSRVVAARIEQELRDAEDVVFYGFWLHVPARVALETRRLLGRMSSPAVSRANGFDLYVERNQDGYLPQREFLFRRLQRVFAASSFAEDYLREHYPRYSGTFTTDRIGTPPAINPGNAEQSAFHIVSCSYIVPVKRLTMLIDDLAEVQARTALPINWTHIGSGTGGYPDEVMSYAAERLTPGSFQFLGYMDSRKLREWYAENPASAFVQVSESEGGLAASIQEGLAQGLPVIATSVGGVSALADDSAVFDGLLAPDHTPQQFADRLLLLLSTDDETYRGYVAASMSFWREHCSADTLASAFAQRLRKIAANETDCSAA